jgi:hypothetical protein
MAALADVPHGVAVTADRPGYPVLVDLWSATVGASPFRLAAVVPAATAVMIACGAAAFARACLMRPSWQAPLFALGVGASPFVALMAGGHADNLLVSVVALAAATTVLMAADGDRTIVASTVLLGSGALIHWNFAALLAVMLVVTAVLLVPESARAVRSGVRWHRTPAVRTLGAVAAGTAVGGAAFLLVPASPRLPGLSRRAFLDKLRLALPQVRWPVAVPAAAVGAIAIGADGSGDRRPRRALMLLLVWTAGVVLAIVALEAGAAAPAHRVLEFALAVPLMATAGVLAVAAWIVRLGTRRGRALSGACRAGAVVLVAGAAIASITGAGGLWHTTVPTISDDELHQIRAAAAYVDGQPPGRPVVALLDPAGGRPDVDAILADHWMRLSVDPDRITSTATYVGDLDRMLAGKPTTRGPARFVYASERFTGGVRRLLPEDPAVIVLSTLNRSFARLAGSRPGAEIAPGVAVIRGPLPANPTPPASLPGRLSLWLLALLTAGALAVTAAVGSGWAVTLLPAGTRAWLSPALGVAALVLVGTAADRFGFRLQGPDAVALVVVATAAGWVAAFATGRRARGADVPTEPVTTGRQRV